MSHNDLAPRNIMVNDNLIITGLIDWENAGWYPEYWEYVKFFQIGIIGAGDWQDYAHTIFSSTYAENAVEYAAICDIRGG